jgi:hypothetical protein
MGCCHADCEYVGMARRIKMMRILIGFAGAIVVVIYGSVYAQTPDEFCQRFASGQRAGCKITRDYVTKAKIVAAGKIDAMCFPDQPDDFDVKYLLNDEANIIDKAVTLSVAKMAVQLYGNNQKPIKAPNCKW